MIAIVGVGAVGGSCAAPLGAVRDDVVLCLRTPFLELKVRGFDVPEVVTPRVIVSPNDLSPARWVLLATKAHQVEGASSWLERLVGSDTRVAVLQNGVEHVERLCGMVPSEQVLPVVVDCPACVLAPGRIEARHAPHLIVPERMEGQAFAVLFKGTSVGMETTADFVIALWRKPCVNAIAALAGVSLPEVRHPRLSEIAQALVRECAAVERAEGAEISDSEADEIAYRASHAKSGASPSTLSDRLAGRPLEADAHNSAVARVGAKNRIEASVNRRAAELLAECHRRTGDLLSEL